MKRKKVFKYISNAAFAIGSAFALYAIISYFVTRSNLPAGVCPIDPARPFLYVAIGFLAVSLITSFFTEKKKKQPVEGPDDGELPGKE